MSLDAATSGALVLVGLALVAALCAFALCSLAERERRAAAVAAALAAAAGVLLTGALLVPLPLRLGVLAAAAALALGAVLGWFLPIGTSHPGGGRRERRVDERDIMFARARLRPGSPEYEAYYAMRPHNREPDERTRALPGLLSPAAPAADPVAFAAAEASFALAEALREEVDGPVAPARLDRPTAEMTALVRAHGLRLGARDVGIAELAPAHVYSHVGRGAGTWGEPIELPHRFAIAFTVEMDHGVMRAAPAAPVVAESARKYAEAAKIAVSLARLIRELGHPARAHIDGNYRVIAPLVARDAGLGEIGRMGLLMTPRLGPRVRIGVVTTDLELVADGPRDDVSVIDFCTVCNKCTENCPSGAIPAGRRTPIDRGLRWAIDPDACFRLWNRIGTDCGRCMTVCPYAHPDTLPHRLVRAAVRRSGAARRAALRLDDLFYGRRPRSFPGPRRREREA